MRKPIAAVAGSMPSGVPRPAATGTVVALARADTVLVWDPVDRTLIAADIELAGQRPNTERTLSIEAAVS